MNSKVIYEPSQTTHWKNLFPEKMKLLGSQNLNENEELIATIKKVAIELNREIVDKKKIKKIKLNNKDNIEVVHFIGGG